MFFERSIKVRGVGIAYFVGNFGYGVLSAREQRCGDFATKTVFVGDGRYAVDGDKAPAELAFAEVAHQREVGYRVVFVVVCRQVLSNGGYNGIGFDFCGRNYGGRKVFIRLDKE